ncbi:MAG: 2-hydroxyacid dehydrogenase [Caldilineaceae bacterium]
MPHILFFTDDSPELTTLIVQHAPSGFTVSIHPDSLPDAEKVALLADADFVILTGRMPPEEAMRRARRLKLIQLTSAGYNHINLPLCRELGIPVANNGGANAIDVAEYTLAGILGFYRRLFDLDHHVRTHHWQPMYYGLSTYNIHGRTAGVVGMGRIGRRVASLLHAFGARVLYYDQVLLAPAEEAALGVTRTSLPDLLRQADIVTLHVSLTPTSHHLIGRTELALLKPTALLVNTCRGAVVDEAALIEVLTAKRILGAVLDVLEQEPPAPDNPILQMDNVLLSPHTAGNSYETWARRGKFAFENIQRVWAGQPPLAVVNQ